jgi:hypothetical protein
MIYRSLLGAPASSRPWAAKMAALPAKRKALRLRSGHLGPGPEFWRRPVGAAPTPVVVAVTLVGAKCRTSGYKLLTHYTRADARDANRETQPALTASQLVLPEVLPPLEPALALFGGDDSGPAPDLCFVARAWQAPQAMSRSINSAGALQHKSPIWDRRISSHGDAE